MMRRGRPVPAVEDRVPLFDPGPAEEVPPRRKSTAKPTRLEPRPEPRSEPARLFDPGPVTAWTVPQFLRRHGLKKEQWADYLEKGPAPKITSDGRRRWITAEAEAKWIATIEDDIAARQRATELRNAPKGRRPTFKRPGV